MSITVENITKHYGAQVALNNVSLSVAKGEILGFLGPNGAGKSTLMKIITGYLLADEGTAAVCGLNVSANAIDFRKKIGYLPEHNPLYPELYVRESLTYVAGIYKLKNKTQKVEEAVKLTGLTPEANKRIGALSKGYKQRVGLAQALIHDPEVLILDEPTSGLDPNQLDEIRQLIIDISKSKTVMLSTHIMQEVEAICNRIVIINKGKILADGTPNEIKRISVGKGQQVVLGVSNKVDINEIESLTYVAKVVATTQNEYIITSSIEEDIRPKLYRTAVGKGWELISLWEKSQSVENIFRELTQRAL